MVVCYRQLGMLVELFSATDVSLYMLPIVFTLAYDKVAQVRLKAFSAVGDLIFSSVYSFKNSLQNQSK